MFKKSTLQSWALNVLQFSSDFHWYSWTLWYIFKIFRNEIFINIFCLIPRINMRPRGSFNENHIRKSLSSSSKVAEFFFFCLRISSEGKKLLKVDRKSCEEERKLKMLSWFPKYVFCGKFLESREQRKPLVAYQLTALKRNSFGVNKRVKAFSFSGCQEDFTSSNLSALISGKIINPFFHDGVSAISHANFVIFFVVDIPAL